MQLACDEAKQEARQERQRSGVLNVRLNLLAAERDDLLIQIRLLKPDIGQLTVSQLFLFY